MTADEIQNIARRLGNQTWCRYWLNFLDSHTNVTMAIQCRSSSGKPEPVPELVKLGFAAATNFLYTIKRTNADGTDCARISEQESTSFKQQIQDLRNRVDALESKHAAD